jgi:tetratricopeptide (TPR) repeat protein
MQKKRIPNDLDNYVENLPKRTQMAADSVGINPALGILGFAVVGVGFLTSVPVIIAGMVLCALGAAHIYVQWQNKEFRAKMHYNKGVRFFNRMQYTQAKAAFEKALELNPKNELAKYGMVRIGIYK